MTRPTEPCQVAILAGGMGTRLKARTGNLPKPMAPLLGRPVLEHLIGLCRHHGFTRIALLVHYEHEAISSHFGDGSRWGVQLHYSIESQPRGTAGALRDALPLLDERFLVLYGDTYADVDLQRLWTAHARSGCAATLLLHPNDHPHDSDLVELDACERVVAVHGYPHPTGVAYRNLVNAAMYVMERAPLADVLPAEGKADLAKHSFPAMLAVGLALHGYVTPEYIKDMGTPERLDKVERDVLAGLPDRLSGRQLRHAVFLDRDGTLNAEVQHLRSAEQLQLLPGAAEAVRQLNLAGRLAVCVTNQPVLARGDVDWAGMALIHATLDQQLGQGRAYLDRLYLCPHHPDRGFPGEVAALKTVCDCRKPATGLIDQAVRALEIDRRQSWMVGDSSADLLAGARAGLRTILVRTGHAGTDGKHAVEPDFVVPDLPTAVHWILHGHDAAARQLLPVLARAAEARLVLVGGPSRAGKSSLARVLAQLLAEAGRQAHVVSSDGWLRPPHERPEALDVCARHDMSALRAWLAPLLHATRRQWVTPPLYDRRLRRSLPGPQRAIAPEDVVILEGVPVLLDEALCGAAALRLHVDADDERRRDRLARDYAWRGRPADEVDAALQQRELDEVPAVRQAARHAHHQLWGQDR